MEAIQEYQCQLDLFDLPWDDILIPYILSYLSLKDLFNLRTCSSCSKELVNAAFAKVKSIVWPRNNSKNIAQAFRILSKHCHSLREINLAKCSWLTNDLLTNMLQHNNRLTSINLNECTNITASSLQPAILKCKRLRSLKLSKCIWITIGAVEAFTLHQSNLEDVDISHCSTISERCLVIFFYKFRYLSTLSMAYTISVTDNVMASLGKHCKLLKHLNIMGCYQVSDRGIM